ncbi:hypothetical protein OHW77_05700 [Acinetobacter baumannii]|nr:hypothetical protein [Acinetobacter baumannii]
MAKKELKDKIKIVGFWTFGGVFWYLVISFFLLSEYPIQDFIFDHKKAYEVLKDALTIAAAFLAPVAAFILFDDWRTQHKEVKIEKDIEQIIQNIKSAKLKLLNLFSETCVGEKNCKTSYKKFVEIRNEVFELVDSISNDITRLNISSDQNDFKLNARDIINTFNKCLDQMYVLQRKYNSSDITFDIAPDIADIERNLTYLATCQRELNEYAINFKI